MCHLVPSDFRSNISRALAKKLQKGTYQSNCQTIMVIYRKTDRKKDRQAERQTDRGKDRQTERKTDKQIYRQTERQKDRITELHKTERQIYRQTERQKDGNTERQRDIHSVTSRHKNIKKFTFNAHCYYSYNKTFINLMFNIRLKIMKQNCAT